MDGEYQTDGGDIVKMALPGWVIIRPVFIRCLCRLLFYNSTISPITALQRKDILLRLLRLSISASVSLSHHRDGLAMTAFWRVVNHGFTNREKTGNLAGTFAR
jgi:hypothetical protein